MLSRAKPTLFFWLFPVYLTFFHCFSQEKPSKKLPFQPPSRSWVLKLEVFDRSTFGKAFAGQVHIPLNATEVTLASLFFLLLRYLDALDAGQWPLVATHVAT